MTEQLFHLYGEYHGKLPAPDATPYESSVAFFCPTCSNIWARIFTLHDGRPAQFRVCSNGCANCPPTFGQAQGAIEDHWWHSREWPDGFVLYQLLCEIRHWRAGAGLPPLGLYIDNLPHLPHRSTDQWLNNIPSPALTSC